MAKGKYLEIPLPYLFFLKLFPFLHSIRLTHRWSILLVIGLTYFSTYFYSKIKNRFLILFILIIFFLETIPKIETKKMAYITPAHIFLANKKDKKKVLLEYPFLNLEQGVGIDVETRRLLASTYHQMYLFNGYTGLFIEDYGKTRLRLENYFLNYEFEKLYIDLQNLPIDYFKVDKIFFDSKTIKQLKNKFGQPIFENNDALIYKINRNKNLIGSDKIKIDFSKKPFLDLAQGKINISLSFTNKTKNNFININQEKILLKLYFYRNNKYYGNRSIYQLYPLNINANETKETTIQLFERKKFNKIKIEIFDEKKYLLKHLFTDI